MQNYFIKKCMNELGVGDKIYFTNRLKDVYNNRFETVIAISKLLIVTNKQSYLKDNYVWITKLTKENIKKNGIHLEICR